MKLIITILLLLLIIEAYPKPINNNDVISTNQSYSSVLVVVSVVILICLVIVISLCGGCEENYEKEFDIRKPQGILNNDETCYVNASVQALASSDIFLRELNNLLDKNELPYVRSLHDFLLDINGRGESPGRNAKNLIRILHSANWYKKSQQDAFDLLSKILNKLMKEIETHGLLPIPPIILIENWYKHDPTTCPIQKYLGLAISLPSNSTIRKTIEELVERYFDICTIDDNVEMETRQVCKEIPRILLLHIQANRYDYDNKVMVKPKYHIILKKIANLRLIVKINHEICLIEQKYELKSIVEHYGNVELGHYVTHRKLDENWYLVNDRSVQKDDIANITEPYLLIYDKIECDYKNLKKFN